MNVFKLQDFIPAYVLSGELLGVSWSLVGTDH